MPTARNDTDSVVGGTYGPESGNVLSGSGTTSGSAGADTLGADGAAVSGFRAGSSGNFAAVGTTIAGQYGTLTLGANGSYTYVRNTNTPGGVSDVFTYQITDGDGDASTATLTINIGDAPNRITFIPEIGEGTEVREPHLPARDGEPAGSQFDGNSETTTGTITFNSPDGVGSVTVSGVTITPGSLPQTIVSNATGTLVVTGYSYNPTTGVGSITYVYTLNDNTLNTSGSTVSFPVVVTDLDGDAASDQLDIRIIDDAPFAANDSDSIAAGQYGPATGNVITDAEGDGGADVKGADGATVTAVSGTTAGTVGGSTAGQYGVLTLNADGSYSYVRNAGTPGGVSDVFSYTITDGDGDPSTATLTISIADSPTTLDLPTEGEAGTQVDEAGLATGSAAATDSEFTAGTIAYTAPDGPATVTIDGVAVTAVGQTFSGAYGTLTITSIATGAIGYKYELTTNTSGDATFDDFAVVVTDKDGDNTPGTLVIDIVDDVPTARADVDSVKEDGPTVADGNVITGANVADANTTDGVVDTKGADGATVTAVAFGATSGTVGSALAGTYGSLTLNADGSYSYTLNNDDPRIQGLDSDDSLTEVFTYTITDGDGDPSTTTLTITINGSDDIITINGLNAQGPDLVVDEDDLADGSSPDAAALTQSGSFTVNGLDGIASIKIQGTEAFVGQTFTTAYGKFTITSISAPADGNATAITVGYSYVLTDNTAHANAGGENFLTELFDVEVTDTDGSTDTDQVEVRIIDDVPTAADDTDSVASGTYGPVSGNVITDASAGDAGDADTGADTPGADGVTVSNISGFGGAGTVGGATAGQYGVLTLNPDGSYTYVRNAGTPGGVSDVFSYTVTDSDGDTATATLTIVIEDARPLTTPNEAGNSDDDALTGGNPGGTGDDPDSVNLTGMLSGSGGDGPLTWEITSVGIGSLTGLSANFVNSGLVIISQFGTPIVQLALNTATGAYTVTQLAPIVHAAGGDENNSPWSFGYKVTDQDGDTAFGSLSVSFDDDTPVAFDDTDTVSSGSNAPIAGNVLTGVGSDGNPAGADSIGADGPATGGAVTSISGSGGAGTIGGSTVGAYGTLVLNADGSYTYTRNSGTPGNVTDTFTYTITDKDGDTATATLTITIADAAPVTGPNAAGSADDDALTGGNPGGTGDDPDSVNLTGTLTGSGGDGALTWSIISVGVGSLSGLSANFVNSGLVIISQFGTPIVQLAINTATGDYTVTQLAPIVHSAGSDENNAPFTFGYRVTDADGDNAFGSLSVSFDDDTPTVTVSGSAPVLSVDETNFTVNDSDDFSGLFSQSFGADGPAAANSVSYTLGVVAGPSGLIDTLTGEAVNLVLNGTTVEGRTATGNLLVFTLTVNTSGTVTLDQSRAVIHDPNLGANDVETIAANLITLTKTVTDGDGDSASATANIGDRLNFVDDAPTALTATTSGTVDEDGLTGGIAGGTGDVAGEAVSATGSVTGLFSAGADSPLTYSLSNNTAGLPALTSGGVALNYTVVGNVLTASAGATPVFTLSLNATTGAWTFTLLAKLDHPAGNNENDITLQFGGLIIATDKDGDPVTATGNLTVTVDDDTPVAAIARGTVAITHDETAGVDAGTNDVAGPLAQFSGVTNVGDDLDVAGTGPIGYAVSSGAFNFAGAAPGADSAWTVTYALALSSAGVDSGVDTSSGQSIFLYQEGNLIVGRVGNASGEAAFAIAIDAVTSQISMIQYLSLSHPNSGNANDSISLTASAISVVQSATDGDGDTSTASVNIGDAISFRDDGPSITASTTQPNLVVDDSTLGVNASASFAGVFSATFGSDGPAAANSVTYALGINAGATGLFDVATGQQVVLSVVAGTVVGTAGVGGPTVFVVSIAADGTVTLDQQRAVTHNDPADPIEAGASAAGLAADNLITITATATDRDGDTATAIANIGSNLQFEDDGPSIIASTTQPILVVDDSTLGVNASASFASVFTPTFGADGAAASNSVTYALQVTAGPSGLVDVATGEAVNLVLNGSVVEGRTASSNQLVFTVVVDTSGNVTLDQIRAVQHNDPSDPDEAGASAATLASDNLIRLVATATDRDGDTATATANIGQNLQFKDDGPLAQANTASVVEGAIVTGNVLGNDSFGADGPTTTTPAGGVVGVRALAGDSTTPVTTGTGTQITGLYGKLTLNADGSYSYDGDPNVISTAQSDIFVYTIRDADGDLSTTTLTINLTPVTLVADNDTVTVNEAGLDLVNDAGPDTVPGTVNGSNPTSDSDVATGALTVAGATGYTLSGSGTGSYGTLVLNSNGTYSYTLTRPFDTTPDNNNGVTTETGKDVFTYTATDANGNSITGTITVDIIDDVPTATATAVPGSIAALDETATSSTASTLGATNIGDDPDVAGSGRIAVATTSGAVVTAGGIYGADGANAVNPLIYNLVVTNAVSGLFVTDGAAINLVKEGDLVVGRVASGTFAGKAAFAIAINPTTGVVTVEQYLSLDHPLNPNPDDLVSLAAGSLGATVTRTDGDGDKATSAAADISGQITFDDDGPTITTVTDPLVILNDSTPSASGSFVFSTGADGAKATNDAISVSNFTVTVNGVAATGINLSLGVEDATFANYSFTFQYPIGIGGTATANGTLVFNKLLGTYTVELTNGPIQGVTIDQTSDADTTFVEASPQVTTAALDTNLFAQFTGMAEPGSGTGADNLRTIDYDPNPALPNPSPEAAPGTWTTGELFNQVASTVQVSSAAAGVGGNTIQGGEVLDFNLYSSNPGGTTGALPTASASAMFLKFDTIGSGEDMIVVLKLWQDTNGNGVVETTDQFTTRALLIQNSDIIKSGPLPSPYQSITLDNNDGIVFIEPNDYNAAGENWAIVGAQIVGSDENVDGMAINFNSTTGTSGASNVADTTTYQDFQLDTGDSPFKISSIGFVRQSTQNQSATIEFDVTVTDGDGDTVTRTGVTVNIDDGTPPVVLDLDGDGAEFLSASAGVAFDYLGDGNPEISAWVGADDGLLAIDSNANGLVDNGSEIVFGGNGLTDLQGLAANYDSNKDGVLDASDADFAKFGVWQDANSNGVTDAGEFQSLSDAGITSINLVSDGVQYAAANGEVTVHGTSSYTKADGTTGDVADASFATGGEANKAGGVESKVAANENDQRSLASASAGMAGSMVAAGLVAAVAIEHDVIDAVLSKVGSFDGSMRADGFASLQSAPFEATPTGDFFTSMHSMDALTSNFGDSAVKFNSFDRMADIDSFQNDSFGADRVEALASNLLAPTELDHGMFNMSNGASMGMAVDAGSQALIALQDAGFAQGALQDVVADALAGGVGQGANVDALLNALAGPANEMSLLGDGLAQTFGDNPVFEALSFNNTHDMFDQITTTQMELSAATGHHG